MHLSCQRKLLLKSSDSQQGALDCLARYRLALVLILLRLAPWLGGDRMISGLRRKNSAPETKFQEESSAFIQKHSHS